MDNNQEYNFPEISGEIIRVILRDFGLETAQEESIKNFVTSKNPEEREKILKKSPGFILAQVLRDFAEHKLSLEKLPKFLEENLSIPGKKAEQIAEELYEKILRSVMEKPMAKTQESIKPAQKPDTYRETLE